MVDHFEFTFRGGYEFLHFNVLPRVVPEPRKAKDDRKSTRTSRMINLQYEEQKEAKNVMKREF
jgi:hypothetical protein